MTTVVCWQWRNGFRAYTPERANILFRAVSRNLPGLERFVCITDEVHGFAPGIDVIPTPASARDAASIPSVEGPRYPACYRRLWTLSDEARCLGDRVLLLDIDAVIVCDLTPLILPHDFVGWRPRSTWGNSARIGGGTWLHRTGTLSHIWDEFIAGPARVIHRARDAGYRGSDQAILSYHLADTCHVWPYDAGIYQSQDKILRLPQGARIVHFNGARKPWQSMHTPWVREHYR